jgi:allophanate hydrolase
MSRALDIATLSAAYANDTLRPETVLAEIYDRIAETGERPVWITVAPRQRAMARLAEARQRRDRGQKSPLFGIPFAVKDNIDVAGLPTTAACPDFAYTATRSAGVVEQLEAAGAILVGKTNLDQFATGLVGTRSPYGICASVFSPEHISGGSSAGSAVAVAAGLVSFALGTDTAGSGRVPAAFNNIVGLKPSKGLISTRGVVPACRTQDCVSIFAGTCGDALAVLAAASAFDAEDPFARHAPVSTVLPAPWPKGFRFGVPDQPLDFFGDEAAAALYAASIDRMESLGGQRVAIDFAPFAEAARLLYSGPWVAERLAALESFDAQHAEAMHPVVRDIIRGAVDLTAVDSFTGQYRLAELCRDAEGQWAKMDVLLLPTTGTTYTIAEVLADPVRLNSRLGLYTNFTNLMDLAAIAVPAGFRGNGLPFGVTLLGRTFQDGRLAALADRLHRALPDAVVGGTGHSLPTPGAIIAAMPADRIAVAVVGAHLSGLPLHGQLAERGARLLTVAQTAAGYSLYALPGAAPARPGLVFDGHGAGGIEVEVWEMDLAAFGSFVAQIPPPLGIGTLTLADGRAVKGFLCEAHAVADAEDITRFGGWRGWLVSRR